MSSNCAQSVRARMKPNTIDTQTRANGLTLSAMMPTMLMSSLSAFVFIASRF